VTVPAGGAHSVVIRYANDLDLASTNTSSKSLRVYFLREISDFRDIWISKYQIGRMVTSLYYKYYYTRYSKQGATPLLVFACALIAIWSFGVWGLKVLLQGKSIVGSKPRVLSGDKKVGVPGNGSFPEPPTETLSTETCSPEREEALTVLDKSSGR
jgi:hypothetical protein